MEPSLTSYSKRDVDYYHGQDNNGHSLIGLQQPCADENEILAERKRAQKSTR